MILVFEIAQSHFILTSFNQAVYTQKGRFDNYRIAPLLILFAVNATR